MEIVGLLFHEIAAFFLIMLLGFLLVKRNVLKSEDSRILSIVIIYLIVPGVILKSFQINFTPEVRSRYLLAFGAALAVNFILMFIAWIYGKLFRLDTVERASIMYGNAGNLVIPLVTAILGEEWVIYTTAFICVQMVLVWTHGQALIGGAGGISWKKILLNVNLIAIAVGLTFLITGIRLPLLANKVCEQLSGCFGPLSMMMIGMLLADVKWGELLLQRRSWIVMVLKMIVTPLIILLLLKLTGISGLMKDARTVLYICYMAVITPSAVMVTQISQMYQNRPAYAGALNALTTLICIVTMPLMTGLYYLVM